LGFLVNRIEFRASQVFAVRLRRQHAADETELRHRPVQLLGRRLRVIDGKIGHGLEARRDLAVIGNKIVVSAAQGCGIGGLADPADPQTVRRVKHRSIDLLPIHRGEPFFVLDARLAQRTS
jgi:hypothetical protein